MLIAVDHGNYSIKTPNFSFVAGLAEHTVPLITDNYLEYDGRFWTLTESRLHYMRDKTLMHCTLTVEYETTSTVPS